MVLAATGVGEAIDHMPAVNALWETGYGQAILVKTGLLGAALADRVGEPAPLASAADRGARRPELGEPAARLLRRLVSGEVVVVVGVVFAAAVLSSLAPPPPAFALENSALAKVGPGARGADRRPRRLPTAGSRLAEQGGRAGLVRAADHQGRPARARRERDPVVQPPRDADAHRRSTS